MLPEYHGRQSVQGSIANRSASLPGADTLYRLAADTLAPLVPRIVSSPGGTAISLRPVDVGPLFAVQIADPPPPTPSGNPSSVRSA